MTPGRWKALLLGLAVVSLTVMGVEAVAAFQAFGRGAEGRWGIQRQFVIHDGRDAFVVRGFSTWSLAAKADLKVGDTFVPDNVDDVARSFLPGEKIAGTVFREGKPFRVELPTTPRPLSFVDRLNFTLNAFLCSLGVLISLAIGFRQADRQSSQALSLAFLLFSTNLGDAYAQPGWSLGIVRVVNSAVIIPGWYFLLWFAVHYPDGSLAGLRRTLRKAMPLFLAAAVAGAAAYVGSALGHVAVDTAGKVYLGYVGVMGPLTLLALAEGWRRSSGVMRQRFSWLLGSFALFFVASYSSWLNSFVIGANEKYAMLVSVLGSLSMYLGLSYAILRHRVLDIGLALNRSLVFAIVGAVLLGSFQFLQVVTARVLHFDDPARAGLLSAVLAVLVVLAYPKVKPRAEWLVDRVFFRDWVAREADLARFVADARGYTDAGALATGLLAALDRFTNRAGAALYVRTGDGRFERFPVPDAPPLGGEAPAWMAADDPLAVALRAGRDHARSDEAHSPTPAEMAMALSRPRELDAFVLFGKRRDGEVLRPDEVAALQSALRSVGAEWHALRWDALQRERAALVSR